jgi:uncharacterized protein (TIGR00725 family)
MSVTFPIIGIMGSGGELTNPKRAEDTGRRVAELGFHLLTGGGGGVMEAASRGFASVKSRRGLAIGVLPARRLGSPQTHPDYPNAFVDLPIRTHLERSIDPDNLGSRNPINILTANGLIFLAGSGGTEAELAIAQNFGKPRILLLDRGECIGTRSAESLHAAGENVADNADQIDKFLRAIKRL